MAILTAPEGPRKSSSTDLHNASQEQLPTTQKLPIDLKDFLLGARGEEFLDSEDDFSDLPAEFQHTKPIPIHEQVPSPRAWEIKSFEERIAKEAKRLDNRNAEFSRQKLKYNQAIATAAEPEEIAPPQYGRDIPGIEKPRFRRKVQYFENAEGKKVSRYVRFSEPLGRGKDGEVYKAWDRKLERWVAIKVLKNSPDLEGHAGEAEAKLIARNPVRGVAEVYDYIVDPLSGKRMIVSELVDPEISSPLNKFVKENLYEEKRVVYQQTVKVVHDLADIMEELLQRGVIHNDFKPGNVLVLKDQNNPRKVKGVKVIDFGLSENVLSAHQKKRTGSFIGTPAYVAPEMTNRKQNLHIEDFEKGDVFVLGAMAFEVLTKNRLLPGDLATTMSLAKEGGFERAIEERLQEMQDGGVAKRLISVLRKALQAEPSNRYKSPREFSRELERAVRLETMGEIIKNFGFRRRSPNQ